MTAINIIRRADSIVVMTDGAMTDDAGIVQEIGQKVLILPYLRAVLAFRGPSEFMAIVAVNLTAVAPRNFEDLVESLPDVVSRAVSSLPSVQGPCEVVVAGISFQRQRAESYILFTQETTMPGPDGRRVVVDAFDLVETPALVAAPVPSPAMMAEFGLGSPIGPDQFNAYMHGIWLMQAQRRTPHSGGRGLFIGGVVNISTITASGVNSEIAFTWPDKLGEKIAPAG